MNERMYSMTPHRLQPAGLVLRQVTGLPPEPITSVTAGLLAILFSFWNLHTVLLFALVVGAGGLDLLAGARRASIRERHDKTERFSGEILNDGMWTKGFYLLVSLFAGMSIDSLTAAVGGGLFSLSGIAEGFQHYTPVTAGALFWRLSKETASIFRNIDQTPGGRDAVFPMIPRILERQWEASFSAEERARLNELLEEDRQRKQAES